MLKTYKSDSTGLSVVIKRGEQSEVVEFKPAWIDYGRRGTVYATEDEQMQKALEAHEYFGRLLRPRFWTDDNKKVEAEEVVVKEVKEPTKKVKKR